jgi:hypothetical protein
VERFTNLKAVPEQVLARGLKVINDQIKALG